MGAIRIACAGSAEAAYTDLKPFQGNLKTLHRDDYEKLRDRILEQGFSDPISVWVHEGQNYILDGHQRLRTIQTMVDKEGYTCPPLPINEVYADSYQEAKGKLLSLASQFGKLEGQGLYEFMMDADLNIEDVVKNYRFADLDLSKFAEEFYFDAPDGLDLSAVDPNKPGHAGEVHQGEVASSGVKMQQLFFTKDQWEDFLYYCDQLKKVYETENVTDTVFKAVLEAYEAHSSN